MYIIYIINLVTNLARTRFDVPTITEILDLLRFSDECFQLIHTAPMFIDYVDDRHLKRFNCARQFSDSKFENISNFFTNYTSFRGLLSYLISLGVPKLKEKIQ